MKPATSSRPCIESAASWSAAIQPSVRSSSAATSRAAQVEAHHLVEVRGGLVGREAQVGGADLDELAARAQAGQRQRRIGAAGDHQVQLRREMVEQEGHPVVDVAGVDDVVVVEHQHDIVRDGAELVEQRGEDRFDRRRLRRLQERERARADAAAPPSAARRSGSVQKDAAMVVALVEREPRRGPSTVGSGVASHSASSVVLPKPAGAETSVSFDSAPRFRRSLSADAAPARGAAWGRRAWSRAAGWP